MRTPMKPSSINRVIFILSILGIAMAIYVTQSFLRQSNIYCVSSGCEIVRKSASSYLFGFFPVPAVGLIGYTILALCAFLRTMNYERRTMNLLLRISLGMATFGIAFVSWFTYTELFIIKGICMWCAISAVNMYVIFGLTIKSYLQEMNRAV